MQKLLQLGNYRLLSIALLTITVLMMLSKLPNSGYVNTMFRSKDTHMSSRQLEFNVTSPRQHGQNKKSPNADAVSAMPCPTVVCPICPPTPTVPAKQTCPAPKPCPSLTPCTTNSEGGAGATPGGKDSSTQASQVDSLREIESSNFRLIEALQRERLHTLKKGCAAWKKDYKWQSNLPDRMSIYSKKYNFSLCEIFKCGYTSWTEAILVMDGMFTLEEYKAGKAQGDKANAIVETKRVGVKKNTRQTQALWDSIGLKIITVRHPFNRLLSAYNNKMRPEGKGFTWLYAPMSRKINKEYKHLRANPLDRNRTDDGLATFEDFINFVLVTKSKDGHWMGFDHKCNPCNVKYDFIMKFETLGEDANFLERKFNLTEEHAQAFFPHRTFKTNSELTRTFYESLPPSLVEKLFRKFEIDFDLFGYEKPAWMT